MADSDFMIYCQIVKQRKMNWETKIWD
jgi:hypothetical protein